MKEKVYQVKLVVYEIYLVKKIICLEMIMRFLSWIYQRF